MPATALASSAAASTPARLRRSSAARLRLSFTDIGSIRPSVLRSSGTSAMPKSALLACLGSRTCDRLAVQQDLAADAAQHAEQREEKLALALAVESAEADDLARPDRDVDVVQPRVPRQAARLEGRRAGAVAARGGGLGGKACSMSRPIIISIVSALLRVPASKVATWLPLRNTEQSSASSVISFMRCEM